MPGRGLRRFITSLIGEDTAPPPVTPTGVPTTPAPTTVAPTTAAPTTPSLTPPPETPSPTTPAPTTAAPTTAAPTTAAPTTAAPTTAGPTTLAPTTPAPTTVAPTTPAPTPSGPTQRQYKFQYHITRDHVVLFPVDGRLGQLLPGSLEDGASTVNIGGKANSARMREGDIFRLVSDDDLLSGNPKAEITGLNSADRVITGITSQTVTVSPGFAAEPNSEIDHFFEYRVLRKSPFNNVTFGRTSQLAFTPRVYLNGDQLSPVITHPTGQVTVITDDFGTLKFTPLGNSRWKLEMAIVVDGSIDVVIPDGSNSVELGLTNMNVYQDIPIFTISDDGTRLGPWNIIHARIAERTVGSSYVGGNPPDVRLRRILVEADRERIPVATTSEFLVVLKNRDDLERINLDGALVTWEVRDSIRRAVKATGLATVVSAGLVRVEIPADALPEGVFSMELEVNLGGNPEFILRSNPMIVYVGG